MNASRSGGWGFAPHSGGNKISEQTKHIVTLRLHQRFAELGFDKIARLEVRFRGVLCYIDAYKEPDAYLVKHWSEQGLNIDEAIDGYRLRPTHLGRLRHFDTQRWSYAFFTYSNEKYEPTRFDGEWFGLPEQGLEIGCRAYLTDD